MEGNDDEMTKKMKRSTSKAAPKMKRLWCCGSLLRSIQKLSSVGNGITA